MNELEWNQSSNAAEMIEFLWSQYTPSEIGCITWMLVDRRNRCESLTPLEILVDKLHRYYLACGRKIWKLLPQEESRGSIEVGELWVEGKASSLWLYRYDYHSEAAAFRIDYAESDEEIAGILEAYHSIPRNELRSLLYPQDVVDSIEPRELLKQAAYFANYAMNYPRIIPKWPLSESYHPFLNADLLREFIEYPGP